MIAPMPTFEPEYSHFAALNALVDGGWLAQLKATELAVLLVYLRHADADGVAHPGPRRIADALGHVDPTHVRRARRRLVELGLLARVAGGGGSDAGRFRVVVPTQGRTRTRAELALGPNSSGNVGPIWSGRLGPNRSTKQHIEQPIEQRDPDPAESHPEQTTEQRDGQRPRGRRRPAAAAAPAPIPPILDTPAFRVAWGEWETFRREKRHALTPTTVRRQLAHLEQLGPAAAVASIEQSIRNGWTGLFDAKPHAAGGGPPHHPHHQHRGTREHLTL